MIVAYHEFSSTPVRDVYAVTRETFARHAQIISDSGALRDCVTFDDAHQSQFSIAAPVLNAVWDIRDLLCHYGVGWMPFGCDVVAGTARSPRYGPHNRFAYSYTSDAYFMRRSCAAQ